MSDRDRVFVGRRHGHVLLVLLLAVVQAACGGGGATDDTTEAADQSDTPAADATEDDTPAPDATGEDPPTEAAAGDLQELRVLLPAESPLEYPHRVAEAVGYYEEEGLTTSYEYAGGSTEVIQQLLAGNGDVGLTCAGAIIEGLSQGFTEMRPVWNSIHGSIFGIFVPEDSDIQEPEELAGLTIGISDPAGGEVPIVRGILRQAGLTEQDVNLLPIGDATAVGVRAIDQGQVDAIGASLSDLFALEVQGLELRPVGGEQIADLPACGLIVTESFIDESPEVVEGFLRATAKGVQFGQENSDAALSILADANPEVYEGEEGRLFMDAYIDQMVPPPGEPIGAVSVDSYERYFEFTEIEPPDVPLDEIIVEDFLEPANDYDQEQVAEDARTYSG